MLPRRSLRALPRPVPSWPHSVGRSFITRSRQSGNGRPVEGLNLRRMADERDDYHRSKRTFLAAGAIAGVVAFIYTAWQLKHALDNPAKLDSAVPPIDPVKGGVDANRKVIIHDEDGRELVPTGNSTVPQFPRTIDLPSYSSQEIPRSEPRSGSNLPASQPPASLVLPTSLDPATANTEYTLVGLGLRSVSFLGIQVYVVGYYIATPDIAALQSQLVKRINSIATTLVPGEKDQLRNALLHPVEGEDIWEELLKEGIPARSLFRVIPVRDTDFHHLRDGFVRAIQARSAKLASEPANGATLDSQLPTVQSRDLGESMREFRQIFNRGKVPKKKELLLLREKDGSLTVVYDEGKSQGRQFLGRVQDERISRALWLNYLAGSKVASEPARKSIVEGVMEFVERPVGTVATQVV